MDAHSDISREARYQSSCTSMFLCVRAATVLASLRICAQGTKIFQYCTCPTGRVTYIFHSSCKHKPLSIKSVCNKEHKGVICNVTSSSNSSQNTRPEEWEELLVRTSALRRITHPF